MILNAMNCHWRYYTLEAFLKSCQQLGYQYIELWTGPMHLYVDRSTYQETKELKELLNKYHLKVVVLCPEQTNPKPNNLASNNPEVLKYYLNIIKLANELNVKKILMTSGWAYLDKDINIAYQTSVKNMKILAHKAKEYGITIVVEALQKIESVLVNTSKQLLKYIQDIGEENVKVCIDFGAMAAANETIDEYFNNCKGLIEHIHFVDGKPTGHLAYGDGHRNMNEDLEALKRNGYFKFLSAECASSIYYEEPWEADKKNIEKFKEVML